MHLRGTAMCVLPFLLAAVLQVSSQQAYPPGVPPRQDNYQQPPQQQQQYQPPPQQQQQYQPPPQQQQQYQQQPPQQQQQQQYQQQQYQQQPPQQQQQYQQQPQYQQQQPNVQQFQQNANPGDHHGGFKADMHNAEHIMEHLQEVIDAKPKEQMTEEELEFHYFKMHDYDNNNKLDGVEIGKALTHFHGEGGEGEEVEVPSKSDEELAEVVDLILQEDDADGDGYIDYVEFATQRAQRERRADAESDVGTEAGGAQNHIPPIELEEAVP